MSEAFEEEWENYIYRGDLYRMAKDFYLAATERERGRCAGIVKKECVCEDLMHLPKGEVCYWCQAEKEIRGEK